MENFTIKIKRGFFNNLNYLLQSDQAYNPTSGYSTYELMGKFKDYTWCKYIPMILSEYLRYGCANIVNGRIFVYWNARSAEPKSRAWNGFREDNKFVCDLYDRENSYMFSDRFFINHPSWKNTDFVYKIEDRAMLEYCIENKFIKQPERQQLSLF